MSVSKIGKENTENGTLVKIDGLVATIKRHSNSEEIQVSLSKFLYRKTKPEPGKTYRYNVYTSDRGVVCISNVRSVLHMRRQPKAQVKYLEAIWSEKCLEENAIIDWFDWSKGYGVVVMLADESTAFVHVSLVKAALQEFGFPLGSELKGQTVHAIVIPDPKKKLRVTRLEFV